MAAPYDPMSEPSLSLDQEAARLVLESRDTYTKQCSFNNFMQKFDDKRNNSVLFAKHFNEYLRGGTSVDAQHARISHEFMRHYNIDDSAKNAYIECARFV